MTEASIRAGETEMIKLPRVDCRSWDELFGVLEELRYWVFRGHCSANWTLQSTLERRNPSGDHALFTEYNITREFKRRAHNFVGEQQIPTTDGEWLALMQRFGAPTRVLDFTHSPFVAAYFAFEELPPDGCDECAIIAISRAWLHERFGVAAPAADGVFGFRNDDILAGVTAMKRGESPLAISDELAAGEILAGRVEHNAFAKSSSFG